MVGNGVVISTVIVGIIVVGGIAGYAFYNDNNALASLSQQSSALSQEVANLNQQVGVLEQRTVQVVTMTNTVISIQTATSYVTETSVSTQFATVTTTSNVYPPSSSTYALTYVTGNSTETQPSCGSFVVSVDVTYEMHQQVSPNLIQWARFPSGQLVQPNTQKMFSNQAYLTIFTTYDYSSGYCSVGEISSLAAFVTDTNNNQLSPSTNFVVQQD